MANLNYNHVTLAGRLTADPELKTTNNGKFVTRFRVAYNRPKRADDTQQADFFTAIAWKETAELIARYFHKGSCILIDGTLQTRSWTDKESRNHVETEILVNRAYFVDSRADTPAYADSPAGATCKPPVSDRSNPSEIMPDAPMVGDDDDLPF